MKISFQEFHQSQQACRAVCAIYITTSLRLRNTLGMDLRLFKKRGRLSCWSERFPSPFPFSDLLIFSFAIESCKFLNIEKELRSMDFGSENLSNNIEAILIFSLVTIVYKQIHFAFQLMFQFSSVIVSVYKVRDLAKPISSTDPALRVLGDSRCRETLARKLSLRFFTSQQPYSLKFSQIRSQTKLLNIRKLTRALFDSPRLGGQLRDPTGIGFLPSTTTPNISHGPKQALSKLTQKINSEARSSKYHSSPLSTTSQSPQTTYPNLSSAQQHSNHTIQY